VAYSFLLIWLPRVQTRAIPKKSSNNVWSMGLRENFKAHLLESSVLLTQDEKDKFEWSRAGLLGCTKLKKLGTNLRERNVSKQRL